MATVCIVGAGAAGLAAAHGLVASGARVLVVDKSRGVGGRAATRWRDVPGPDGTAERWRYDHGAQVLTLDGPGGDVLRRHLADALVPVGAVWPFDSTGVVHADEARDEARWAVAGGMSGVGRALVEATPGLDLRLNTTVKNVQRGDGGWLVATDDGLIEADAVLVTAPAPQAAALLTTEPELARALAAVAYRSQWSLVFAWRDAVARPDPYALVHVGSEHPVAWLAVESDKPGRAPAGATVFVAQMSPSWTRDHDDLSREAVAEAALPHVEALVGASLPPPLFTDAQRWRYSLPDAALDASVRRAAEARGLFVAGDGCVGQGRVHRAVADGLETAARLAASL